MRKLASLAIAGAAGTALVLGLPAAAGAANNVIKIDKSINKVRIGNKQHVVINKVGEDPKKIVSGTDVALNIPYKDLYFSNKFMVRVLADDIGTTWMTTKSKKVTTSEGIGVGSTKGELKSAYDVICERVDASRKICHTGPKNPEPGETRTDFRLTNNVITEVSVVSFLD